jgi:hypothetical protein
MSKSDKNSIEFNGTLVFYGKTTLHRFLSCGYSVKAEHSHYDKESVTYMVAFFKNSVYMGELVFYDIPPETKFSELANKPIHLVLLEDNSLDKKESFGDFLEFTGESGRKGVKFITGFYLFAWLICAFFYIARRIWGEPFGEIPRELVIATAALPAAFFGVAFMLWCIKRFFRYCCSRFSRFWVAVIFICILLAWNGILTFAFVQLSDLDWKGIPLFILPAAFLLLIAVFISYQLIIHWLNNVWEYNSIKLKIKQLAYIFLIWLVAVPVVYYIKTNELRANIFVGLLALQYLVFCLMPIRYTIRLLAHLIFDNILPRILKK